MIDSHSRPETWNEYRNLVLDQLESARQELSDLRSRFDDFRRTEITSIQVEIAVLKVKASMWGAAMGFVASALVSIGAQLLLKVH